MNSDRTGFIFDQPHLQDNVLNIVDEPGNNLVEPMDEILFGKNLIAEYRVVIAGRANSGKSSLFNSIIGYDRSIVSRRRGTTRDTVEAQIEISGVTISLIDTAGFWESNDFLNNLGVKKTIDSLKGADICILVDENNPSELLGTQYFNLDSDRYLFVKSKCDLNGDASINDNIFNISSKTGKGIKELLTELSTLVSVRVDSFDCLGGALVNRRQRVLLQESFILINDVLAHIKCEIETDVIASTMRSFLLTIQDVVGEVSNQDVIENIFSNFCIG